QVTTQAPANTVLLDISVTDPDADQALSIAEAVSDQLVDTLATLDQVEEGAASPVKATVVTPAAVGSDPVSPQIARNLALAAVLGLLLGVGLALVRDLLDTSIRSEEDARALTEVPILGGITFDKAAAELPMVVIDDPHHTHSEAFRTLRTNLQFVNAGDPPRSIVLTSSLPEEGKTTTTAHLALTLSATGKKVCVIEGDLRRPRLMEYLGMEGSVGLTNVLIGEAEIQDMLQPYGTTNLTLLGSGPIPPNPAELLGSERMKNLIADLVNRFDTVIIDAPPLLPVTDAAVLAGVTDGAIIVVGTGVIKKEHLVKTLARLEQAQGAVLGLILNRLPVRGADSYYYADYTPRTGSVSDLMDPSSPDDRDT
ncbi:MAG: polysaccharide biosynthesis tyrosine autokinase, partial [Ornithinimicrobium sp.]